MGLRIFRAKTWSTPLLAAETRIRWSRRDKNTYTRIDWSEVTRDKVDGHSVWTAMVPSFSVQGKRQGWKALEANGTPLKFTQPEHAILAVEDYFCFQSVDLGSVGTSYV